jgi:N-acetylmuramoyl-L-alanine amidase
MMRDQLLAAGFTPSTYRGSAVSTGGRTRRGLNLVQYPSILIELGK